MNTAACPVPEVIILSSDHLEFDADDDEPTEVHPGPGPWTLMVHSLEAALPSHAQPCRASFSSITVVGAPRPAMRPPPAGAAAPAYSPPPVAVAPAYSPPSWVQPLEPAPPASPASVRARHSPLIWTAAFAAMGIFCGLFIMTVLSGSERPAAPAARGESPAPHRASAPPARPLPSVGVVMPDGVAPTPAGRRAEKTDKSEKPGLSARPQKREPNGDKSRTAYANLSDAQLQRTLAP